MIEISGMLGLFLIRFVAPVCATLGIVFLLRKLDSHWQRKSLLEAWGDSTSIPLLTDKKCWSYRECSPERREQCPAYKNTNRPCWEAFRTDGHLQEKCWNCSVLSHALAPIT